MFGGGFRDQMPARNLDLFIFRVTGNSDHFHAVQKGRWNVERIGGGDEHDIREVIIHFQIVIVERAILFGIKNLQQSR